MPVINRSRKFFVLVILFLTLLSTGCLLKKAPFVEEYLKEEEKRKTEYTEELIRNSNVLKALDDMCNEIPKPERFEFIRKSYGINSVFISHGYYSQYDFADAKKFYSDYFTERGWELFEDSRGIDVEWIRFRKENYEVQIGNGFMGETMNYSFTCKSLQ